MGCTNSTAAQPPSPEKPPALNVTTDRNSLGSSTRDSLGGSSRGHTPISPANVSSRFRSVTSFDMSAIQLTSKEVTNLDMILDFYKLPDILRYVLSRAEMEGYEITDDLLLDCNNLYKRTADILVNSLYPTGGKTSSSVIRLASRENASDKFLEMIESTYKGTQRSAASLDQSLRVTLIYKNGTSKTLLFNEPWKYWTFIRAIKRSFRGINKPVSLDCCWVRHNSVAPATEKSFWSSIGGPKPSSSDTIELNVEVADGVIWFNPGIGNKSAENVPPETPVGDLIAVSLACDYSSVRTLALEVSFLSHTWDLSALGGKGDSHPCIEAHHTGRPGEVPITFSDLGTRQFLYLTENDLTGEDRIVLKVMTDNTGHRSDELHELGRYELQLKTLRPQLEQAAMKGKDECMAAAALAGGPDDGPTFSDSSIHDTGTLPSLTPYSSALPPAALVEYIVLSVPDTRRMYKLVVHSAVDVLGGEDDSQALAMQHKLNLYAVVELYSRQGELLSPANYHKTRLEPATLCPVWEAEFNFPLQVTDKEIDTIVVRVRDGSGYLRHKTVGQISIPVSVFVSVSEMALLRLPIDSADMTTGETVSDFPACDSYGMISIGTQTCPRNDEVIDKIYGGFVDSKTVVSKDQKGPTPDKLLEVAKQMEAPMTSRLVRQMSAAGQAVVSFCVREMSVCDTCWPYQTLSAVTLDVTTSGAARRRSASAHPIMPCSFGQGHLFTGADHLVALPGSDFDNSLIRWCSELDPHCSLMEPVLRIPWSHVKEVDTITDTSLVVTVLLHRTSMERRKTANKDDTTIHNSASAPAQGMEKFRQYSSSAAVVSAARDSLKNDEFSPVLGSGVTGAYEVEILIAPCPSVALARIINERTQLCALRKNVKSFLKQFAVAMSFQSDALPLPRNSFSFSSPADTLSLAKSVYKSVERIFMMSKSSSINSIVCGGNKFTGNYSPADICLDQRSVIKQGTGSSAFSSYAPSYATEESIHLRLRIMVALLMDVCSTPKPSVSDGALESKQFIDRVTDMLRKDEESASDALQQLGESCADKTTKKIDFVTEASLNTMREVILCGWDGTFPDGVKKFSDILVLQTLHSLRKTLKLRLGSSEVFDQLEGFTNKTAMVKYVLENNDYFCSSARTILGVIGLSSEHLPHSVQGTSSPDEMLLLSRSQIGDLMCTYATAIVAETKSWLAKTLNHYVQSKTNKFGIPWDVDSVGSLSMSPIPETLRFQLNAYMSVCYKEGGDEMHGHVNDSLSAAGVDMDARDDSMLMLNECVVKSVVISLQLVADEYKLALQCKHWEDAGESNERASNLSFLVAVANDCHRILRVHLPDALSINTPDRRRESSDFFHSPAASGKYDVASPLHGLVASTTTTFEESTLGALKCIVRVVFSDLLSVLVDFDSHWLDSHEEACSANTNRRASKKVRASVLGIIPGQRTPAKATSGGQAANPVETIIATLSDYFRDLRIILEPDLFLQTLALCAQVCVVRYMLFLRHTAEIVQSNELTVSGEEFVSSVEADVSTLRMFFSTAASGEEMPQPTAGVYGLYYGTDENPPPIPGAIAEKLNFFDKIMVVLHAATAADVKLQTALRELALSYGNYQEGVSVIECLLQCCATLHPAASPGVGGPSPAKAGAAAGMRFHEQLLDAWSKQLSGARRQSLNHGTAGVSTALSPSDLLTDAFYCAFRNSGDGGSADSSSGGLKGFREKAVLNGDKKKRDLHTIALMRSLGLIDPDRESPPAAIELLSIKGDGYSAGAGEQTPGRKRFSATDSIRAAAAFLNTPNVGSVSQGGLTVGENGSTAPETVAPTLSPYEIFPTEGPVIDIMVFNIKTRNLKNNGGGTNPYVSISLGDNLPEQKTKVQWSATDETVWEEDVIFRGVDPKVLPRISLSIKVFDKDRIRGKKVIGGTDVSLGVLDVRTVDSWFALSGGSIGSNSEVHLSIMKRP